MNAVDRVSDDKLLSVESHGQGKDVVLLHGWGMHGGYWQGLVDALKDDFRLHCIDLPGHGGSVYQNEQAISEFADRVMQTVDSFTHQPFSLMGWSLGGLIGQRLTVDYPDRVNRLMLIASTPSFVRRPGWVHAVDETVLKGFADNLLQDYKNTLNRFLTLQVRGSAQQQQDLRELKARLFSRGEPDQQALAAGLALLQEVDLREAVTGINTAVALLGGERDTLVPLAALPETAKRFSHAKLHIIKGAGHAPFLSHPGEVVNITRAFLINE